MNDITRDKLVSLVSRVRRVRKWLVLLATLKVAALSLVFVSLYIAAYAWLDHKLNFGQAGRLIALALLICGAVALLVPLARFLIRHISCSQAANYIERNRTFDQQLVAAVEYYENEDNYPYSKRLAERLVLQADKETAQFDFDWTVPKWQAYAFSAVVLIGASIAGFFLHDNYVFFSSYLARLVRPTAEIAPLPPTTLESITTDIRVEPGTVVTLAASIKGQIPEQGAFVLTAADPNEEAGSEPLEALRVRPLADEQGEAKFELSIPMEKAGRYAYQFEAGEAASPAHEILVCNIPKINRMSASVQPANSKVGPAYTEDIEDHTIEVTEDSVVTLHIEASEPLQRVQISDAEGRKTALKPSNSSDFEFTFTARKEGFVEFAVTSSEGVENSDIPALQVLVKCDEPPVFKLVSPAGDYTTTNVASVPVKFEVTDDFGLNSATARFEIAGRPPMTATFPIKRGSKSQILSCVLEMEEYNLGIGDSIIMYAEATDIDIATEAVKHTAISDLYFIEIRPYRQIWHQMLPPPPPDGPPPDNEPGEQIEFLIKILEYTRAIVKKTWVIANKPEKMVTEALSPEQAGFTEQERSRLDSIRKDVVYCREQLEYYVDRLGDVAKPTVEKTLENYDGAAALLSSYNAKGALVHEKEAYRLLRILVVELEKVLMETGGGGAYPKERDSVVMDEKVHLTRYEKERVEWELEQLADRLDAARLQQERIRDEFENFLAKQDKPQLPKQEVTDERTWISNEFWPSGTGEQPQIPPGEQGSPPNQLMPTVEGALKPPTPSSGSGAGQASGQQQAEKGDQPPQPAEQQKGTSSEYNQSDQQGQGEGQQGQGEGQGEGQGHGEGQGQGSGQGQGQGSSGAQGGGGQGTGQGGEGGDGQGKGSAANKEERMRMLGAKQKSLQQRTEQLQRQLKDLPEVSKADRAARQEANRRLDAAQKKMDEFQERLEKAYYEQGSGSGNLDLALLALDMAADELDMARSALSGDISMTTGDVDPFKVEELAEEMAELAEALDTSVSGPERAAMLARLEQANALLRSMSPRTNSPVQGGPVNRGPGSLTGSAPGGGAGRLEQTAAVTTQNASGPAEHARALARQFWSMAIKAKKQQGRFIDDEPSDARFYEKENDFFEEAAKAGPETSIK